MLATTVVVDGESRKLLESSALSESRLPMRQVLYLARIFVSELHPAVECLAFGPLSCAACIGVPLPCVLPGAGAINIMAANRSEPKRPSTWGPEIEI
jgi:hypothetical protein